jgi:diaminopimelate decarboxylase
MLTASTLDDGGLMSVRTVEEGLADYEAIAEQYGTPFYLYDMDAALSHLRRLKKAMPACVDILFAMKANPNPRLLELYRSDVTGLDISSGGEMALAQRVGYAAGDMSFAGPGKTDKELRSAIEQRIHLLSVESLSELERVVAVARELGTRVRVTLRINPSSIPNAFMMKMGGRPSQFGIAEEEIDEPLAYALGSDAIELCGLHVYSGTQCLDRTAIVANLQQTLELNAQLVDKHGFDPQVVNLGGGFGVAYFPGQEPLDNDELAAAVGETISAFVASDSRFARARFILELGRYLIGPFGTYVARVVEVKRTRGKRFVIMDGGMNHCFAATGNFGQLVKKNYQVDNLSAPSRDPEPHELVGPLCTPLDSMARSVALPRAEPGDLVAFRNCGAYSYTASPLLFLGHDTPIELVRIEGRCEIGRRAIPATHFA